MPPPDSRNENASLAGEAFLRPSEKRSKHRHTAIIGKLPLVAKLHSLFTLFAAMAYDTIKALCAAVLLAQGGGL